MKRTLLRLAAVAACALTVAASAQAAEKVVWQIGQFDNNFSEFAIARNYPAYRTAFPKAVRFRVGQDDPAKSWPYIQPGPDDGAWAGKLEHPFTIYFPLSEQPAGVFTLTIDFVSTQGAGGPEYEIAINNYKARVQCPAGPGDEALADPAKGREHVISIPMPASLFKQGDNKISLTIVSGSWALFDALRLTNDPAGSLPPMTIDQMSLSPTPRIVRVDGKPKRAASFSARLSRGMVPASVTIKCGESTQRLDLSPNALGEARTDVFIDDLPGPAHVEATVTCESAEKSASWDIPPQKHWKLYVQACSHIDIGYTNYQERIVQTHNKNTDTALDLCAKYPRFKWNTEVAWVEDNFLSMMPKQRQAEFVRFAQKGQIGCPAIYGNMLTGICSHEELIRDLYYAHDVARRNGIPFDIASSADVPTQVWTLPSILAGSGIRYFSTGLNLCLGDAVDRPLDRPFYWQGPDGSRVLAWYGSGYGFAAALGLTASVQSAEARIDGYLHRFDRPDYPCDAVFAYGGVSDNQPLPAELASVVDEWNKRYVSPEIILCRGPEFFQYVEKNWKGKIPVISGDGGVCWEDGAASSAMETAKVRIAKEKLVTAEKLSALTTVLGKQAVPVPEFDAAWKNAILYDEHTWGAAGSISSPESDQTRHQWKVKQGFAIDAARQADSILSRSISSLSKLVRVSEPSVLVYNPLSWAVSGWIATTLANGRSVSFHADDVPPLGYRLYASKSLPNAEKGDVSDAAPNISISNQFYTLSIDPETGAIKSLLDRATNRELVDKSAPWGLNQYVYLSGKGPNPTDVTAIHNLRFSTEDRPCGHTLIIRGSAYKTPEWTAEIVLHNDEKRIDFINTLYKAETYDREAGYFAFPFRTSKPRFHIELPNGVVRPDTQMQPGGCMQWYCPRDFAAVEDDDCAITWTAVDSPLVTLGDINREAPHRKLIIGSGHLFAYVFNNRWFTNYKASQGGKMVFRFALTSDRKYDPVHSARFGQSVRTPLIATAVSPSRGAAAPGSLSLCQVSPANVVIQSVKQAQSGRGLVIRLRELSGSKTPATLSLAAGMFHDAYLCNLMEDPQTKLKITNEQLKIPLTANGLATVRMIPK